MTVRRFKRIIMSNILILIDGFNFYHRLNDYEKIKKEKVKWLNYRALMECYFNDIEKNNFEYIYFSAKAYHSGDGCVQRHETYIAALEKQGIKIQLGKFKKKTIGRCKCDEKCVGCTHKIDKTPLEKHEEKNTDVNIAITLVEKAINKEYDACYILSSDSDFDSAIERAMQLNPAARIIPVPPPLVNNSKRNNPYYIENLMKLTGSKPLFISWKNIKKSQFPNNYGELKNPWS